MPENKLKDNEIIKALECCALCKQHCPSSCPLSDNYNCQKILFKDTLDLINRQKVKLIKEQNKNSNLRNERNRLQAKFIKEQNKNSKLRNERNRLQVQSKDLAETIHNLTLEKDALFDKAEKLKAENERLQNTLDYVLDNEPILVERSEKYAKAEAYKEFAERLETKLFIADDNWNPVVTKAEIDETYKELAGEDK